MKKNIFLLLIILLIFPLKISASETSTSALVMDIQSGRILYQKNSNTEMLIASTGKLLTFYTALKYANNLNQEITVGEEVLKMYGTNMYLSLNEKVKLIDLLYGLLLRSGNDASVVIATYITGNIPDFVTLMNEEAKKIGMINSNFQNPHGLDEETKNYSTAFDLATLTRHLYLNYPLYQQIAGSKYYNFKSNLKSYELINRCKIIFNYSNITTAKNGYTPSAGKSLVTTAKNDNLELLIVTLNDSNIYENHQNLYEYYFKNYQNYLLLDKNNFQVGNIFSQEYYIKNNFSYPLTKDEYNQIETKIIINNQDTNTLGTVKLYLKNQLIYEENIYPKINNKSKKDNILKKIIKFLKKLFK